MNALPPGTLPDGSAWEGEYEVRYVRAGANTAVYAQAGWSPANPYELATASRLADNGFDAVLLRARGGAPGETIPNIKTPDLVLLTTDALLSPQRSEKSAFWEMKGVGFDTDNLKRSAQRGVAEGKKQSGNIVLFVRENTAFPDTVAELNSGVAAALHHDQKNREVRQIILLREDGKLQFRSAEEFVNGHRFQKF